jgi:SnoaL-like domain
MSQRLSMKEKKPKGYIKNIVLSVTVLLLVLLYYCHRKLPSPPDIHDAMATYDRLILKTDADSIALLYMAEGDLGNKVHGRDSIRKFLQQFKNFKVLQQHSTIDSLSLDQDTGYMSGRYHQEVIVPVQDSLNPKHRHDTVNVNGKFASVWIRLPEYGWRIQKMETK